MVSEVHRLHRAFEEAERRADTAALDALLADDFRSIGDQGYVLDKAQWIGKFADFAYTSLASHDVEVLGYGPAAIVRCVQHSRSTWRGRPLASTVRVSQTWVALPGGWRLAGLQFSALDDAAPAAGPADPVPGLRRIVVSVADRGRSLALYRDVLGLTEAYAVGDVVALAVPGSGTELLLHERPPTPAPAGVAVSFLVSDVDTAAAAAHAAGARIVDAPADQPWGERQAVLTDPDGHVFCLVSTPAAA